MTKIQEDLSMKIHFQYRTGILYFKDRIFIPREYQLAPTLLHEFHSSSLGGHSGIKATLAQLFATFYWPYGLLQPLPMPDRVCEDNSMDFITNLPSSSNKTAIWVVVDRLMKLSHFIALPTGFTAPSLASVFLIEIYRLHSAPKTIVSDRDLVFISKFWREVFKRLGTTLAYSSSYHPQTDGQTEVLNRCLETYLRCFVIDEPHQWTKFLPLAEFWHNTSYHSAIGITPFEALYGRPPPSFPPYSPGSSKIVSSDSSLTERHQILQTLKFNLKLQLYRQVSIRVRHS